MRGSGKCPFHDDGCMAVEVEGEKLCLGAGYDGNAAPSAPKKFSEVIKVKRRKEAPREQEMRARYRDLLRYER